VKTDGRDNSLLTTRNLSRTINFATRIQNNSSTAIDNIFVDSTRSNSSSAIICSKKFGDFRAMSNIVLSQLSKWFSTNNLALNLDKNVIKFMTDSPQHTLSIGYKERCVEETVNTSSLVYLMITA
jgi:hypothetical protein